MKIDCSLGYGGHSSSSNTAKGEVKKNCFDQFELLSYICALTEIEGWNVQFWYIVCDDLVYFVALPVILDHVTLFACVKKCCKHYYLVFTMLALLSNSHCLVFTSTTSVIYVVLLIIWCSACFYNFCCENNVTAVLLSSWSASVALYKYDDFFSFICSLRFKLIDWCLW